MPSFLEHVAMALADIHKGASERTLDLHESIEALQASADDAGCSDDLIVVSRSALERVALYADRGDRGEQQWAGLLDSTSGTRH